MYCQCIWWGRCRNGGWAVNKQYMAGAVRETKFSDGKCWLGRRNGSWVVYRRYMGGAVRRFNSLMVNAGSGGLGGYYEVASIGRIGRKQVFLLMNSTIALYSLP